MRFLTHGTLLFQIMQIQFKELLKIIAAVWKGSEMNTNVLMWLYF